MGLPGPAARLLEDFSSLEDLPVAMSLVSCDGRLLRANESMCALLGRSEPELLGADVAALMAPDQQPGAADLLQALVSGRTDSCERVTTYLRPDGTPVDLLVRCASVRDAQGTVALLVEHAVDNACPGAREALDLAAARAEQVVRLADLLQTAGRDARAVAAATSEALHAILGGGVTVFIVDPADGVTIEGTALRTDDPLAEAELRRLYAQVPLRTDLGLLGEACRTGRPVIVEDPWATAPPSLMDYFPWLVAHPVRALLLVPLLWEGRVLALLGAGRHDERPFADEDVAYVAQVARQVSTALADALLLQLERSTARRERAVTRVTHRCDEALGEPDGVLHAAVGAVAAELDGHCAIWLRAAERPYGGRSSIAHPDPVVEDVLRGWLPRWAEEDDEFLPRVLEEGRRFLVGRDQVAALAARMPTLRPHADAVAVESLYGVRLTARGQVVGLLTVGSGGALSADDRRLVDTLADRVALALDNAALLEEARSSRSQARALVEHCSDLLLMADADGRITYASPAAARTFGGQLGRTLLSRVVPEDRDRVAAAWLEARERPGPSSPVDVRVVDTEGRLRRLSAVANNLLDDPGVRGVVLTVRDVTEERAATERLAQRAGQQAALAAVGATALTADLDALCAFVAKAIPDTLEATTSGVMRLLDDGRWLVLGGSDVRYVGTRLAVGPTSGLATVAASGVPLLVDDYLDDSQVQEAEVVAEYGVRSGLLAPVLVQGKVWGAVSAHSDVPHRFTAVDLDFVHTVAAVVAGAVERTVISDQALAQATTDELTGLPNRVVVHSRLTETLSTGRWDGTPVALLLLDLDDFKDVNDSLGHGAGDDVIAQLGHRLAQVVGGRGLVARLGGDEFGVVLPCTGVDAATALADDLARSVAEPFALPGIDITLSTSIGIALAPQHGTAAEHLLQAADMAMYRAKVERSSWAVYDAELDSRRSERLTLLSELRVAISSGQLVLHYQPLVELATERVVAVEALVRWNHPQRGLLLPGAFLPTAEQTELVHGLTRHVVRTAARQARTWRSQGWDGTVAVNLSAHALRPPDVVEALRDELKRGDGALTVELTESALFDERARAAVHTLAEAGVRCSVDDFGTGWSSLSYLRDLPITRLKLDRAFNRDVHHDERDAAIVGSVVQMAHALGLDVVAEGVETAEVAARLRELEVDLAQGWLYGRPQPAAALRLT